MTFLVEDCLHLTVSHRVSETGLLNMNRASLLPNLTKSTKIQLTSNSVGGF